MEALSETTGELVQIWYRAIPIRLVQAAGGGEKAAAGQAGWKGEIEPCVVATKGTS